MSAYALKTKAPGNGSKVISILREFDPSLSIGEIRKRMQCDDFVVEYDLLAHIRFICLAMTEEYIENHFDEIISYESEVEDRLVEADCTIAGLTADNKKYVDGFQKAGERVVIIDDDYEETIICI